MSDRLVEIRRRFDDDAEFARESLVVLNKRGQLVPFEYNPAQQLLSAAIAKIKERRRPVRIVILKSRRAGFSTGVAGKLFKETPFLSGQKTLVVAHEGKAVKDSLFPMYDRFQTHYKPFGDIIGLPLLTSDRKDGLDWENDSSINIQTAKNLEGARSFGFRRVHLSEFAFYPNAKTLMLGLMQTVPRDPDTIVIVESTANGVGGPFYDLWQRATAADRQSEWVPIFFPWFKDPDNWMELETAPDQFQRSLTREERELMQKHNLHLEHLYFRRWVIENDCEGDSEKFKQEYPSNPREAFLVSGRPRFPHVYIDRHEPTEGTIGALEEEEIGTQKELIFYPRPLGELKVFRRPARGRQYVIGADTALGLDLNEGEGSADPDFSVAQVFDRDTGEQVAIWRARQTEAAFGGHLYRLIRWYNWAYLVPEVQKGYGRSTLDTLLALGCPTHLIYNRRNEKVAAKPRYEDLGWETNTVTRPQLLTALERALMEGSIIIYDETTLQELRTFVIKATGKAEGQTGCHDDCVIALALAVIGIAVAPRKPIQAPGLRTQATQYSPTKRAQIQREVYGRKEDPEDGWND